jgi:hypothetical protein
MEGELLKLAASQGICAALSLVLIFYILKTQEKRDIRQEEREKNYQDIILKLSDKLNSLEHIEVDIQEIKEFMKIRADMKNI